MIESWYWRYRMLAERHGVVKPVADKGNSFGQDGCTGTNLLRGYLDAIYRLGRQWS
ncbi:MAG: hypothetical protein QXT35_01930 [Conexivisphaerales archaeon]